MKPMLVYFIIVFVAVTCEQGVLCVDDKFSQLPDDRKQELIEAFSRSDVHLVHEKLKTLRENMMKKLQTEASTKKKLQQRIPDSGKAQKRKLPKKNGPTILPIHEINRKANLSEFMYQADIVLTLPQIERMGNDGTTGRKRRQAYRDVFYPTTIWGSTVYYYFDSSATNAIRTTFLAATQFWQQNTCITFQENRYSPNRIRVFKGQGCYSYVGKVGGQQDLSLGKGCESVGTAAHELGHALGFFHSQSRVDRDENIDIIVANIQPDYVDQFNKESSTTNYNYGMPYDYGSVMQYGASSASRNGKATMVAKDGAYQETMGSDMVSFYDVSMMNEHYNCKARCEAKGTNCQNGGFPNPNNCSICICPSGYGGTLCNERPPGCGETLTAGTNYAQMTSIVGDGTTQTKTDFLKCAYWIQAPPGKLVQVRLDSYQGYAVDGCIYGGVEIKSNPDQLRTGYRLCSDSDVGTVFTASSNLLPVITFNRYGRSKVTVSYRYVDSGHLQPEGDPTAGTPATTEIPQTTTTTRPVMKCVNYFYDCSILAFFGYCDSESVRLQCSRACGLC